MFPKLKTYLSQLKMKMEKNILAVAVWTVSVVCVLIVVSSTIVIILAKLSEESPTEYHGFVNENEITQLKYESANCPKISYFYRNPTENTLYLKVIPDTLSTAGVMLSLFRYSNSSVLSGRLASCFAAPGSQCSIQIPKNVLFHAAVTADSNMDNTVDTILFRWECLYTTNVPLITATVLLTVNLSILLIVVSCVCARVRILKMLTRLVSNLNNILNEGDAIKTPVQLTLDDMLYTDPIQQ